MHIFLKNSDGDSDESDSPLGNVGRLSINLLENPGECNVFENDDHEFLDSSTDEDFEVTLDTNSKRVSSPVLTLPPGSLEQAPPAPYSQQPAPPGVALLGRKRSNSKGRGNRTISAAMSCSSVSSASTLPVPRAPQPVPLVSASSVRQISKKFPSPELTPPLRSQEPDSPVPLPPQPGPSGEAL